MKRTQLYMEEDVWDVLKLRSSESGLSISELVRQAVRDRYLGDKERRRKAMEAVVGIWADRTDLPDTETYVRQLRRDTRMERLRKS